MIALSSKTRRKMIAGGLGTGSALGVAATLAATAAMTPVATAISGTALLSFLLAGVGALARTDVSKIRRLTVRNATGEDLERLQQRLCEFTPTAAPLEERMRISRKNPGAFRILEDLREGGRLRRELDIVALYPLSIEAMRSVESGAMRGSDIRAKHVTRSFRKAAGIYVSFAEGSTFFTRGLVLKLVEEVVASVACHPVTVATIPTTPEALKVVRKRGFREIDGSEPQLHHVCLGRLEVEGRNSTRQNLGADSL